MNAALFNLTQLLWTCCLQRGLFVRRPAAPDADKRKRLRAILRTAREIAKASSAAAVHLGSDML
jgi:hypothetical protein